MNKTKIILVTGGARSGKSLFAENYAAKSGQNIAYIATSQIFDEEMQHRVQLHRERRPKDWHTFEAPFKAHQVLTDIACRFDAILFDCLTLYTSNLMFQGETLDREAKYKHVMDNVDTLLTNARKTESIVIFVTNEVGLGIVPDNPLAREYRDLAGVVNQKVAAAADEVYMVISGLAVEIKKLAVNIAQGGLT